MKLVLLTLIIFFGTLLAAGLVALGEPAQASTLPSSSTTTEAAAITPER
jgi:hypothetical protein